MGTERTPQRPEKRTWRSRLIRYSLRGMFVLVFVVCALLAAYVWLLQDFYEQKAIARELQEGVQCQLSWRSEYGEGSKTKPGWLQQWLMNLVGDDPSSQLVGIYCRPVDGDQLDLVLDGAERSPHLKNLDIDGRLDRFRAIPRISRLTLAGVFDDRIVQEVGRHESLEALVIFDKTLRRDRTDGVSRNLQPLANLQNLRRLELYGFEANDECMSAIAQLRLLEHLDLSGADVADADFTKLKHLPNLKSLTLPASPITDDAIAMLAELKQLKALGLDHVLTRGPLEWSPEQLKLLQVALPNAKIYHGRDLIDR